MHGYLIERNIKPAELPGCLRSDVPDPVPDKFDVVVDVHYAATNFFDVLQVQGKYQHKPPFPVRSISSGQLTVKRRLRVLMSSPHTSCSTVPHFPRQYVAGAEFSGVVSKSSPIPSGCPFVPGKTRVFGAGQGAYATKIKLDWRACVEVPEGMAMREAAGLFVTYPTSYAALVYRANLKKDEFLLIHAAAGGVGLAALQLGKALGAKVIATASTQAKLDVCKKAGADYVVNYKDGEKGGWQKKVMEITKGKGADVIYDPVGMIIPSLKCIAWNGRAIVVGFAGGDIEKIPANLILLKNIAITGVHWGAYTKNEAARIPEVWAALLEMFRQKRIKGIVYEKEFKGLESVPAALTALSGRETWGKAIVTVGGREKISKL